MLLAKTIRHCFLILVRAYLWLLHALSPGLRAATVHAPATGHPMLVGAVRVRAPGGYSFVVLDADVPAGTTAMTELCLSVSDLDASLGGYQLREVRNWDGV
jgi:hypothetical protein